MFARSNCNTVKMVKLDQPFIHILYIYLEFKQFFSEIKTRNWKKYSFFQRRFSKKNVFHSNQTHTKCFNKQINFFVNDSGVVSALSKNTLCVLVSVRYVMFAPIYVLGVVFSQCVLHQVGLWPKSVQAALHHWQLSGPALARPKLKALISGSWARCTPALTLFTALKLRPDTVNALSWRWSGRRG